MLDPEDIGARLMLGELRERMFGRRENLTFGRFEIRERLGRGAHGEVYLAHDAELDRLIALKLLSTDGSSRNARDRLLREAQALARLKHPNVLTVYDVGVESDRIFIAVEYVEGGTFADWCDRHPLGSRVRFDEILRVGIAIAQGLAAAHEAGLVHRDVKPANILIGSRGRPRVADFGVARLEAEEHRSSDEGDLELDSGAGRLTGTGDLLGTPAYMAPEQFRGEGDMASDQWSLCATLWESAYGRLPFELADRERDARSLRPARAGKGVPPWWHEILRRGLSQNPRDRWPSLAAFASALQNAAARRRRRATAARGAVVAVLLLGGIAGAKAWNDQRIEAACRAEGDAIDAVWNVENRKTVRQSLLATGVPNARSAAENAAGWIEEHTESWRGHAIEACRNATVWGTWDAELYDRAKWCLEDRRVRLQLLVEQLEAADRTVAHSAVVAAAELQRVEPCLDEASVAAVGVPPVDARLRVLQVRRILSVADTLRAVAKYDEALAQAIDAREQAESLGWDPLIAVAEATEASVLAHLHRHAEAEVRGTEAYLRATRSSEWGAADKAAEVVTHALAVGSARYADAELWAKLRGVAIAHAGDPLGLREARAEIELGRVRNHAGQTASAIELHESALRTIAETLGAEHPSLVIVKGRLGGYYRSQGDLARARALSEEAVRIAEHQLGPEHPSLSIALDSLASVHWRLGELDTAEALIRRALRIERNAAGWETLKVAHGLEKLGILHTTREQYSEAVEAYREALEILNGVVEPDHPQVGRVLENLAVALRETGEIEQAVDAGERALSVLERAYGPDDRRLAYVLTGLAETLERVGRYDEGIEHVERAVRLDEANPSSHRVLSLSRLAMLLWDAPVFQGRDRKRARAIADRAWTFAIAEEDWPRRFAPLVTWLQTHRHDGGG